MEKETKKRILIICLGIASIVLLLIGMTFALFSSDIKGLKEQSMTTGCLKVEMTDDGNIKMENAMPQKDERGLENTPYTSAQTTKRKSVL